MSITVGSYVSENSDLKFQITRIVESDSDGLRCWGVITNKRNNILYEIAEFRLEYKNIAHWIKVE
jgi:hypothetical protein